MKCRSQQREKAFIHLLSSFKQMKNKTKELSVCNKHSHYSK